MLLLNFLDFTLHKSNPLFHSGQGSRGLGGDVKAVHGTRGFVQSYFNARLLQKVSIENAVIVQTVKFRCFNIGRGQTFIESSFHSFDKQPKLYYFSITTNAVAYLCEWDRERCIVPPSARLFALLYTFI